jgi:hypothetical protein
MKPYIKGYYHQPITFRKKKGAMGGESPQNLRQTRQNTTNSTQTLDGN